MDFYTTSINASLMYKTIDLALKGPVLALRISNTQEKVRNRTRTKNIAIIVITPIAYEFANACPAPERPYQQAFVIRRIPIGYSFMDIAVYHLIINRFAGMI